MASPHPPRPAEPAPPAGAEAVRARYGRAARRVLGGEELPPGECCAAGGCCAGAAAASCDPITRDLYAAGETDGLPATAVRASLGCGNPAALAELRAGETVLDLGSGGGLDVLLSARRVGPGGRAYGLDMTDEMLALARRNAEAAGATNVEFLRGHIEQIPLPDASVDVVISNCVVNLAGDKRRVLAEAFRVLRPGGRFAVSDVVVRGEIPAAVRRSAELWLGCVAGALEEREFAALLADAGFEHAAVEPTRVYAADDVRALVAAAGVEAGAAPDQLDGRLMAAFVRATKPAAAGDAAAGPPALRPARPDDLPAVRRLLGTAGLPTAGLAELFGASAADFVVADDPGAPGELAAVAGIEVCGDDALLRSVAVRAAWRGRGLARALVGRVADDAARRGLGALYLLTTTAAHYFPRLGFARVARDAVPPPVAGTVEFRGACPASATAMVRRLRP